MKRILGLGHRCGVSSRRLSQLSTEVNTSVVEPEIVIPKRIPRGPTDILRALESTISRDPTAPPYKCIDDPFLIPSNNYEKRSLALSKESGRSAARYMLKNFPECFKNDPAEPSIAQFNPSRRPYRENDKNTEEDLLLCIEELDVAQSMLVYENLENQGIEVTQETLLKLLQIVSYFNGKPPPDELLVEERFYLKAAAPMKSKSWDTDGLAEKIFAKLKNKDAAAYSTLISGMLKYDDVEEAYRLYEEMRSKNLVPTVHAYNHLIKAAWQKREDYQGRVELLLQLLQEMSDLGVRPNVTTFNHACDSVQKTNRYRTLFPKILAEMEFLGIKPRLSTFAIIIKTLYRPRGVEPVIGDVVERVLGETVEIQCPGDFSFLPAAMEVLATYEPDSDLAYALVDMAERNPDLINSSVVANNFYRNFFCVLCLTENFDKLMLMYHRFVPNVHSPDSPGLESILKAVEEQQAYKYLPELWSDVVVLGHAERSEILKQVLLLTSKVQRGTTEESARLQEQCMVIVRDTQARLKELNEERDRMFRLPIVIDAEMISHMMLTFLNGNDIRGASKTFTYLIKNQTTTPGVPSPKVLALLAEKACEAEYKLTALACAKYSGEIGHDEIMELVKKLAREKNFGDEFLRELEDERLAEQIAEEDSHPAAEQQ